MMTDEDFLLFIKCVCVFLCVVVISIAACTAHSNHLDYQLKTDAMAQGYEQRIESNYVLWSKTGNVKVEQQ